MQARTAEVKNQLHNHREFLYRYAVIHLRDRELAEDLVQEALLAAVAAAGDFKGGSSLRTWLISILKHKIIDHIRKDARAPALKPPTTIRARRSSTPPATGRTTSRKPGAIRTRRSSARSSGTYFKPAARHCRYKPPACFSCAK